MAQGIKKAAHRRGGFEFVNVWQLVPFEAFDEATRLGRRERCIKRGRFVC